MRNKVDDIYGYNETVSAMISKMCLIAYEKYDNERANNVDHRPAMARAIGDSIKTSMTIITQQYHMDNQMIERGLNSDHGYVKHIEKAVFMKFAEALYDSGNYRVEKFNNNYEYIFKYQLAVFKIGELNNSNQQTERKE